MKNYYSLFFFFCSYALVHCSCPWIVHQAWTVHQALVLKKKKNAENVHNHERGRGIQTRLLIWIWIIKIQIPVLIILKHQEFQFTQPHGSNLQKSLDFQWYLKTMDLKSRFFKFIDLKSKFEFKVPKHSLKVSAMSFKIKCWLGTLYTLLNPRNKILPMKLTLFQVIWE